MTASDLYNSRRIIRTAQQADMGKRANAAGKTTLEIYPPEPPDFGQVTPEQQENAFQQQLSERPLFFQITPPVFIENNPMPAPHFNNLGIDYIYISLPQLPLRHRA